MLKFLVLFFLHPKFTHESIDLLLSEFLFAELVQSVSLSMLDKLQSLDLLLQLLVLTLDTEKLIFKFGYSPIPFHYEIFIVLGLNLFS